MKKFYLQRRSYLRYNDNQVIAYLNEEVHENYVPEDAEEDASPQTAYSYDGELPDGGTMLTVNDETRDSLINAIIRTRYSQTEEDAIKTHQLMLLQNPDCEKKKEYESEWAKFLVEREYAIRTVDSWEGIDV